MIEKKYNEKSIIELTNYGKNLAYSGKAKIPDIMICGILFILEFLDKDLSIEQLFEEYFSNTAGNYMYMEEQLERLEKGNYIKLIS
ncbi:MAG: hypothetical protein K0U12_01900 [Gammaproteobacteria bacterium]|nr:hypothetical protein [Gammaproteobacteria bacterium]